MADTVVRFKDFTRSEEPVTFKIGDDVFECVPEVPLDVLMEMAELAGSVAGASRREQLDRVYQFFEGVMIQTSYETFRRRMQRGAARPIGMLHFRDIMTWMMEIYGLRPTQPSAEFSDGSATDGISSTDAASVEASTS